MGIIPTDIPNNPYAFYSRQKSWISFPDFFGKLLSNRVIELSYKKSYS